MQLEIRDLLATDLGELVLPLVLTSATIYIYIH